MPVTTLISISAVVALLPAAVLPWRGAAGERGALFWLLLGVAVAGALVAVAVSFAAGWRTGLAAALWATIGVSLALFALVAAVTAEGWRLSALLVPYLVLIGIVATVWQDAPERAVAGGSISGWTGAHIVFALLAYGCLTVGAVAGSGVFIQERALKTKRPNRLSRLLPPIADGERVQVRMLQFSVVLLVCSLATGVASRFALDGSYFVWDHKTVLTVVALAVICLLLVAHSKSGMRGRRAARVALLAYLLLTLAYPGVKFVTDVLAV